MINEEAILDAEYELEIALPEQGEEYEVETALALYSFILDYDEELEFGAWGKLYWQVIMGELG